MTSEQIEYMVQRFLGWRLPENFNPDAGISFKPYFNEHTDHPMKSEPTGTNLFDYGQAKEMIRYLVDGMPVASAPSPEELAREIARLMFTNPPRDYVEEISALLRSRFLWVSLVQ